MQFSKLAGEFLVVEEKLDGTGVSLFFDHNLSLRIAHRGSPAIGKEFTRLHTWADQHEDRLFNLLEDRYVLFGEWMLHKHAIFYDQLSDYFYESDIYDNESETFLSTAARNSLLAERGIRSVPVLAALKPTKLSQLTDLVRKSMYQSEHWREVLWNKAEKDGFELKPLLDQCDQSDLAEGLYIKHEDENHVLGRYKYVRRDFVENIINSGTHLRDRIPFHNISVQGAL